MGNGLVVLSTIVVGVSLLVLLLALYLGGSGFWQSPSVPKLEPQWWGPGQQPAKEDTSIRPFKINVPDDVLEDLNRRLDNTRMPSAPLEGTQFEYGFNSVTLKKVLNHWRTQYKWRERETMLNRFPQYKTQIQGLDIHYIHIKPAKGIGLPLLLLHGWPGSVREFYSLIELLTNNKEGPVFEIIAPSLPGYGWSSGAVRPGLGPAQMAVVLAQLMRRVGHTSWYVQGGDWGAFVGSSMAAMYPKEILGLHSNMCAAQSPRTILRTLLGTIWPSLVVSSEYQSRMYPLSKVFSHILLESGYMHIQATKPDTVATGLNDSPAGLAAYILEKFSTWTNPAWRHEIDGGLLKKWSMDDLLDNVMIYWVTGSITTSVRLYAENFSRANQRLKMEAVPVTVPTACARFRHELLYQSDSVLKDRFTQLVRSKDFEDGGHFAAMELPEIMAKDITEAILDMEKSRSK